MIVLTGPVGGEGGQLLFRNGADRVLKPLPEWYGRAFLALRWRESLVLLRRIQGIQRLADDFIRRAVARPGDFLLSGYTVERKTGSLTWRLITSRSAYRSPWRVISDLSSSSFQLGTKRLVHSPAVPGLLSVQVREKGLIPLPPFYAEDFPKDQLIDLIPEYVIGKRRRIPVRLFGEPFHRFLRQFVQMLGAEAALTGQKEVPVLGTKGVEHGRLRHRKGRGELTRRAFPREIRRAVAQLGHQIHGERGRAMTLPHSLHQLLVFQPLQRPLQGPE
jgi:hypothetical protein